MIDYPIVKKWITKEGYHAWILRNIIKPGEFNVHYNNTGISDYYTGYVGIFETNKLYDISFYEQWILYDSIDVHGGITFSNFPKYPDIITGNPDSTLYAIGFDCTHYGDSIEICDIGYVTNECEKLSEQLFKFEKGEKSDN